LLLLKRQKSNFLLLGRKGSEMAMGSEMFESLTIMRVDYG